MSKTINVEISNYHEQRLVDYRTRISELIHTDDQNKYIAAKVNNEITSTSYVLEVNSQVEFLTIEHHHGMQVYRRSLSFLLSKVVSQLYPDSRLIIGHSLGPGYYFDLEGVKINEEIVQTIDAAMRAEVKQNKPIKRAKISYIEACEHFKLKKRDDKYKLLASLNRSKVSIYKCDDFFQLFEGALALNTNLLDVFQIIYYKPGFILQFPRKSEISKAAPFHPQKKIFEVYREYKNWGKVLKVDNVGSLNDIIINKNIKEFISVAEALHEKKIANLANEINQRKKEIKLITIAGPSSSGKTTFSKRLAIQLKALGLKPVTISVDRYFKDISQQPLDINGKPNFESIDSINTELFNQHLQELFNGKVVQLANYSFYTGKSSIADDKTTISDEEIIIIEGIHGLNEKLTYSIPAKQKYKIYISALTQMNIDDNNRIPTTDNRIIRRMVRDHKYRGHSATRTIQMWSDVREGEEKYIFPFQNEADGYFNSALDYELAILKPYAQRILVEIKPNQPEYSEAIRLLMFLNYFLPIPADNVPPTSIIREFIGGSAFKY
ncbi:MAG: nucleoside kinase [Spirochaetes bacterium]|nr:nucleoside kinase [Spirochaetota bacterium]